MIRTIPHPTTIIQFLVILLFTSSVMSQNAFFREGYVITKYNDTIHGLIKNTSEDEIRFRDSRHHEQTFLPADLKGFSRCDMKYISILIPGDTAMIFIASLRQGTIDLYGTIQPEGSSAMANGFMLGGLVGGLIATAATGSSGSTGAGVYNDGCEKEYYSIGAFYLRKGHLENLRRVPNGRKKFNSFMIPLMRDHLEVVREIPEDLFITGNLMAIVRQYNAVADRTVK
jgi:hypothetical protein